MVVIGKKKVYIRIVYLLFLLYLVKQLRLFYIINQFGKLLTNNTFKFIVSIGRGSAIYVKESCSEKIATFFKRFP